LRGPELINPEPNIQS